MKVALVINDNFAMWQFRRGLIKALVERGLEVYTITPSGDYTKKLEALGTVHISVPMDRFMNPINDFLTVVRLYRIFRRERFDVVHNMQVKPTIYGAIAARLARVPRIVALVPGLGYPFYVETPGTFLKLLGWLVLRLLRIGCRLSDRIWFQNVDDLNFFVTAGIIPRSKAVLIRGSGVNVEEFSGKVIDVTKVRLLRDEMGFNGSTRSVAMVVARLIWSKGIKEFVEAAEIMRTRWPEVRFVLVGTFEDRHPDVIPRSYFEGKSADNLRVITEFREDVREILWSADIVVLPSYFREGVPRILLEALSLGKPIITTDHPGCREVVDNGENGLLVPVKDPKALANAVIKLIEDEPLRKRFGENSRRKAESEFDERKVVNTIITQLYAFDTR
jgi:N,N'-diacetylbacillosaminyl-diphospho-undecaprenol alpha-1,3-N-acetylgalactosaminyltransferase